MRKALQIKPGPVRADGGKVWFIEQPTGEFQKVVTSASSAKAIRQIVSANTDLIRRLGKR